VIHSHCLHSLHMRINVTSDGVKVRQRQAKSEEFESVVDSPCLWETCNHNRSQISRMVIELQAERAGGDQHDERHGVRMSTERSDSSDCATSSTRWWGMAQRRGKIVHPALKV
jgi:hypothetical protein